MPMGLAGRHGKCRGDSQKICSGLSEGSIELRDAQIIAYRHGEHAPWEVSEHSLSTGTKCVALEIPFAIGEIDIEHVNFVITGDNGAARVDQIRTVCQPALAFWYRSFAGNVDRN